MASVALASGARAQEFPLTAARVNGVYEDGENEIVIVIVMLTPRKLQVSISLTNTYQGPSGMTAAQGAAAGEAALNRDVASFGDGKPASCNIRLQFLPKKQLEVSWNGEGGCEFSPRTSPNGTYTKTTGSVHTLFVPAPFSKPTPAQALTTSAAELDLLAATADLDKADVLRLGASLQKVRQKAMSLAERPAQATASLKAQNADLAKHSAAAAAAGKRVVAPGKPASPAPGGTAPDPLAIARAEYGQAMTIAASFKEATASLRALEDGLQNLVVSAADSASSAADSAKDAASAVGALAPLEQRLVANAKKDKAAAAQQVATQATAKRGRAKVAADEAKKASTLAAADAKQLATLANLGPASAYAARKARLAKEDEELISQWADAQTALAKLEAKAAGRLFCDMRKVDWKNLKYDFGKLRYGSLGKCDLSCGKQGDCYADSEAPFYNFKEVAYGDLDGDGVVEAVVSVYDGGCGHGSMMTLRAYAFAGDNQCAPKSLGVIETNACAIVTPVGKTLVVDSVACGEEGDTKELWTLSKGQLRKQR